jgi:hypothetical protein
LKAVAPPAVRRPHDVQADEAERLVVSHGRDAADRLAVQRAEEKAGRVGGEEDSGVVPAGVPALGRGPVHGPVEFGPGHAADGEVFLFHDVRRPC